MSIYLHVMKGILANFARSGILAGPEMIISHDTGGNKLIEGPMQNIGTICVSSILLIHTHDSNKRGGGRGTPIREGDKYVWTN